MGLAGLPPPAAGARRRRLSCHASTWLKFEIITVLTSTGKVALEQSLRCPSSRISPFVFSWQWVPFSGRSAARDPLPGDSEPVDEETISWLLEAAAHLAPGWGSMTVSPVQTNQTMRLLHRPVVLALALQLQSCINVTSDWQ